MYVFDLIGNVPLYAQQDADSCGPATLQMVRNGYPSPPDRLFFPQQDLWNTIQVHNSKKPIDVNSEWDSDPSGLTGCVNSLVNPAGVTWRDCDFVDPRRLMFSILASMYDRGFPSPVLINAGEHWVTVIGMATDIEPTPGRTPALETVSFNDPWYGYTRVDGAIWFKNQWAIGVKYPGTWRGKYVAVVESPVRVGTVRVRPTSRPGARLLSAREAVRHARRSIIEMRLPEEPKFSVLGHNHSAQHGAILVRPVPSGRRTGDADAYYIVPFGLKNEASDRGTALVRVCVIVNAHTGAFEEVTSLAQPIAYLTADEALAVAASAWATGKAELNRAEIGLYYQASAITQNRAAPFWRIKSKSRTVYIEQSGRLFAYLRPATSGN